MTIRELPPREKQVAEVVYRLVECGAAEVHREFRGNLSISTIRSMLLRLEEKKVVKKLKSVGRVTYSPAHVNEKVRQAALERVVATYFGGSRRELLSLLASSHSTFGQSSEDWQSEGCAVASPSNA